MREQLEEKRHRGKPKATLDQFTRVGCLCDFANGHGFSAQDWATSGLPIIRIQNLNGSREFNYFSGIPR